MKIDFTSLRDWYDLLFPVVGLVLLMWWVWLYNRAKQQPVVQGGTQHLPENRDVIVRLLTEFEQQADVYFQKSAAAGPRRLRFMDWHRRPPVDKVMKRIQAEFRVASSEEPKAAWVEFQKHIDDIVARGRDVTKQTLPGLRGELKTTVTEFLAALDRGDI